MKKASCIVIIENGLVLGIYRDNTSSIGLVGGTAEPNETPMETVIRECQEECGVVVTKCREIFSDVVPGGEDYYVTAFLAEEYSGELKSSDEGKVEFMRIDDLCDKNKSPFAAFNIKLFMELGI